jgi:hypothetical protein
VVRGSLDDAIRCVGGPPQQPAQVRRILHCRQPCLVQRHAAARRRRRCRIEHDLVDELRLVVFPVQLGGGNRLFGETTNEKPLRLLGSRAVGDGLTLLVYQVLHP